MRQMADLDCKVLKANRDCGFDASSTRYNKAAFEHALDNTQAGAGHVRKMTCCGGNKGGGASGAAVTRDAPIALEPTCREASAPFHPTYNIHQTQLCAYGGGTDM